MSPCSKATIVEVLGDDRHVGRLFGSMPTLRMAANSSASLPKPHVPTFLLFQSSGLVMLLSLNATWSVPDRWKTWPMTWTSAPDSREASILGTQEMPNSALPPATTVGRHDVDAARQDRQIDAFGLVEALVERSEVAGELGLGEPLQLQADLGQGHAGTRARTGRPDDGHRGQQDRKLRVSFIAPLLLDPVAPGPEPTCGVSLATRWASRSRAAAPTRARA